MLRIKHLIFTAIILSLIKLSLPIKTVLAHEGSHDNYPVEQKTKITQPKQIDSHSEIHSKPDQQTDTSPNVDSEVSPVLEESQMQLNTQPSSQLAIIPRKGELIFILVVLSPFFLNFIKLKIHNTNLD
jgi:hypothetical protein